MADSPTTSDALSPEQQTALEQYTAVTGQPNDEAIPLLRRSQWNIQIAITKFFDGEQPDPVAEALAIQNAAHRQTTRHENLQDSLLRASSAARRSSQNDNALDVAPRIVPQPADQVATRIPFLFRLLFSPLTLLYRLLAPVFSIFGRLFPFLPRLFVPSNANGVDRRRNTTGRRSLNPQDTMARFKREFEEEFGPNSLPFVDCGYAQALDKAKKDLKFLLVILISPEHDDTTAFLRETLLAPEVISFLNQPTHEIVLWAGSVLDSEAYQVSTGLKCTKLPVSVLIAHTPERGATTMSVVARIAGPLPASLYITQLKSAIDKHKEPLAAERASRQAQQFDRNIRQEQDSAYERSLAQDRERTRQRREAEIAAANAQKQAAEDAVAAELYKENLLKWRTWRANSLEAEPAMGEEDNVRIGLKMPDTAERVTRRFRGRANIEELYAFVECYELIKTNTSREALPSPPNDFKHNYSFRIVSPIPRQVYSLEEGGSILERIGRSGNLIVEPITEEEDEED